ISFFTSSPLIFGVVNVKNINSLFSSSLIDSIIIEIFIASLRAFLHAQIGQKRFLQSLPFTLFFFSLSFVATNKLKLLHILNNSLPLSLNLFCISLYISILLSFFGCNLPIISS